MSEKPKCQLCGEPMPDGEEMFTFHGYSGPCPKPPLEQKPIQTSGEITELRNQLAAALRDIENHKMTIKSLDYERWALKDQIGELTLQLECANNENAMGVFPEERDAKGMNTTEDIMLDLQDNGFVPGLKVEAIIREHVEPLERLLRSLMAKEAGR